MKKLLLTILSALLFVGPASAQQLNWTEINVPDPEQPSTVHINMGMNYLVLEAQIDAVFHINIGYNSIQLYECTAAGVQADTPVPSTTGADGKTFNIEVTAGQTYRFMGRSTDVFDAKVYYGDQGVTKLPITITSATYEDGDEYTVTSSNLELVFDRAISVANPTISYMQGEDGTYAVTRTIESTYISPNMTPSGYYYVIELNKIVQTMIDEGDIRPGDKFKITLNGIADQADPETIYGEDGVYSVELVLGEPAAQLVSMDPADGTTLYTYYPEGGEGGLLHFTFTDEIDPNCGAEVTCTYGDPEAGSYRSLTLPYTIEGTVVTVNIQGIFFPETVASSRGDDQQTSITVRLKGLRTVDGRDVQTNYVGGGSTSVLGIFPMEKEEIQFYYDSDPQDGGSLQGLDEIMLWLPSPYPLLSFEDLQWSWDTPRGLETRTIPSEDVQFEYDEQQFGYTAMVPLTGVPKTVANVTLTMRGAVLRNGDTAELELVFNVPTGIDNVEAGEGNADEIVKVYTISGTLVKECKRGEATEGLAKGVYIIGGKKMVVR